MQPATTVLTIDGGFATQLTEHVGQRVDGDPLWSARFNATQPLAVVQTHLDFLRAGAQVILTNTYQASVSGYGKHLGLTRDESLALMHRTVQLAVEARAQFLAERPKATAVDDADGLPWIVGSIGPYGAHLNDGSEYTGVYGDSTSKEAIKAFHRDRLQAVCAEGVDGLAIETIPCALEANAMVELMAEEFPEQRYWMSFQCNVDGVHLAHAGEVFAEVARDVWQRVNGAGGQGKLMAVGVNCLNPELVSSMLGALNEGRSPEQRIPTVVYPNSGELYSVAAGWTGKAACTALHEYVPQWIELGARFIGGCCRTYARDIELIASRVREVQNETKP